MSNTFSRPFRPTEISPSTFESFPSVVFSADLIHSVTALEDSAYLIVIGGRLDTI